MKTTYYSSNEKGQGLVEYSLILVLVAVVTMGVLAVLGPAIRRNYVGVVRMFVIVGAGCTAERIAAGSSDDQDSESWKRFKKCMFDAEAGGKKLNSYFAPDDYISSLAIKVWV